MILTFNLRRATAEDQTAIKRLIRRAEISPFGLHWSRFTLAVDKNDAIIGCEGTMAGEERGQGANRKSRRLTFRWALAALSV